MDTFSIGGDLDVRRLGFGAMRITGTGTFRIRFSSSGLSGITSIVITVSLL